MNKLAKAKTLGMILLAALLIAAPIEIVTAQMPDNPSNAADHDDLDRDDRWCEIPMEVRINEARLNESYRKLAAANLPGLGIPLAGVYIDPYGGVIRVGLTELKDEYTEPIKAVVNTVPGIRVEFFEARFTYAELRRLQRKFERVFLGICRVEWAKLETIEDDTLREGMRAELWQRAQRTMEESGVPLVMVSINIWYNALTIGLREIRPEYIEAIRRVAGNEVRIIFREGEVRLLGGQHDGHRPVIGGIQIRSPGLSTLSFKATRLCGEVGFVMTGHAGWEGQTVWQPASPRRVGRILVNPPIVGRRSDAAFVRLDPGVGVYGRIWARVNEIYCISRWLASGDIARGSRVWKQGITTGKTSGILHDTGVLIGHPDFGWLVNQSKIRTMVAAPRDSGSPVFRRHHIRPWEVWLGGILWGESMGYILFSPMCGVRHDLSLEWFDVYIPDPIW